MHPVEAPHDKTVHHVDHRLGDRGALGLIDRFKRMHALLNNDIGEDKPLFAHCHFVALFTVKLKNIGGVFDGHDAHAIGSRIGLHNDKGLLFYAVLFVLELCFG